MTFLCASLFLGVSRRVGSTTNSFFFRIQNDVFPNRLNSEVLNFSEAENSPSKPAFRRRSKLEKAIPKNIHPTFVYIGFNELPSRELTYPTLGKRKIIFKHDF